MVRSIARCQLGMNGSPKRKWGIRVISVSHENAINTEKPKASIQRIVSDFPLVCFMNFTLLALGVFVQKKPDSRQSGSGPLSCRPMTRTEKLLAELIARPSVNPAFVAPEGADLRRGRPYCLTKNGERDVADFLAAVAAKAGLGVEFQRVLPGRSNLLVSLQPRSRMRQTILLAPHLDTVNAEDSQFVPRRKNGRLHGRGACDTKGSVAAMLAALCELAESKTRPRGNRDCFRGIGG